MPLQLAALQPKPNFRTKSQPPSAILIREYLMGLRSRKVFKITDTDLQPKHAASSRGQITSGQYDPSTLATWGSLPGRWGWSMISWRLSLMNLTEESKSKSKLMSPCLAWSSMSPIYFFLRYSENDRSYYGRAVSISKFLEISPSVAEISWLFVPNSRLSLANTPWRCVADIRSAPAIYAPLRMLILI